MFHNGPASISTCFDVIDALSMESYVTPKVQILGKYVLLGFFPDRQYYCIQNPDATRMKGDYHTKMFTFIDKKKSKHHIRLKCIRKELNQTIKNIEIITYTCKRVFSDTFYF